MKKSLPFLCCLTIGFSQIMLSPPAQAIDLTTHSSLGTVKDHQALEEQAAKDWQQSGHAEPLTTESGEILYPYGHARPTIECAPLHVCVIHLMKGEKIMNLSLGDTVRWIIQTGQAGDRAVVVIKPSEEKLATNLVITTSVGRIYYLNLVSRSDHYLPMVGFYDPEQLIQQVETAAQTAKERSNEEIATLPSVNLQDIDFNYWCEGAGTLPVRVFSTMDKVFIEIPKAWQQDKTPVLFTVEHDQETLTNYELKNNYYIVNHLFKEAHLVIGSGDNKDVITIHQGKRPFLKELFN